MTSHSHPTGLTLEAPSTLSVEQTERGFIFSPSDNATVRSPTQIIVELRQGALPAGSWPERHRRQGRTARYRIDIEDGGSGGEQHVLRAWEESANGYFWLEQAIQVEAPGVADFGTAWRILESASVKTN